MCCIRKLASYDIVLTGANVYYKLERFEEAIADCQQAIEIDPNFTKAYYRQGLALYEQTDVEGS